MIATVTLNPSLDEWVTLPRLAVGDLNRATAFHRYPGGKGLNVSRVVHELGGRTRAFALCGGEDGAILRGLLARQAIPAVFVGVAGTTRNNYKLRTLHPRTLTEINTAGPRVSTAELAALERRLLRCRPTPRCVVLSGSLPPGVPATMYARWIRMLRDRRIPVALDTSGTALTAGVAARPWLIKPNRQEAEALLRMTIAGPAHALKAARRLQHLGPELVLLSLGKDGAILATPQGVWEARPPTVAVDSAVGAGDSLLAGMVLGWARGASLCEAFRLGVACGTASAMTPGTELCRRRDVMRLRPRVRVRAVMP